MIGICDALKAIMRFWNHFRDTEFFKEHPILSDPATCLQKMAHAHSCVTCW